MGLGETDGLYQGNPQQRESDLHGQDIACNGDHEAGVGSLLQLACGGLEALAAIIGA